LDNLKIPLLSVLSLLQLRGAVRQRHLHFRSGPGHVVGLAERNALAAAGVSAAAGSAQGAQGRLLKTRKPLLRVSFFVTNVFLFYDRLFQRRLRGQSMRAALHVRGEPPSGPSGQPWRLGRGTAQTRFHVRHFRNSFFRFLGENL
jgi:hypothetical protein